MFTNATYQDHERTAALIYNEIIADDDYRLRALALTGAMPAIVYDIGANIGMAALHARFLFPSAEIVCLEPCPETFAVLNKNVAHLNIYTKHAALATTETVRVIRDARSDGSNRTGQDGDGETVPAITLGKLVCGGPSPYVIKLDCEGGEASIIGDAASEYALRHALHWAMEFHPPLARIAAVQFKTELERIDKRTTGRPTIDGRWLFWSQLP